MLCEQTLFLNSRSKFNDPFDSQPTIKDDLPASAIRNYLNEMMQNPLNPIRDASTIAKILQLKSLGKTHLNKAQIENIKKGSRQNAFEYLDECGLLSFSLTAENPLLWGHYAASFMGICAVFRRSNSIQSALSICAEVSYVEKRPQLPLSLLFELATNRIAGSPIDEVADRVLSLSFLHKDSHWSSEQEARIFYPFKAFKKIKFDTKELVGIIFGPKSPPELVDRLSVLVRSQRPVVSLHQASLSQTEFRIIVPHNYLRSQIAAA